MAAELATQALAVEPRRERALYWLGYTYEQKGDFARALAEYAKADPSEDVHGIMLASMGILRPIRQSSRSATSGGAAAGRVKPYLYLALRLCSVLQRHGA